MGGQAGRKRLSTQYEQSAAGRNAGLWQRLNSWWGGEADERAPGAGRGAQFGGNAGEDGADAGPWPPERILLLEGLFGPGMITPAGDAVYERLSRGLDLPEDARIVELGAGMGGIGHRLASDGEATVFAFDDEVENADLAQGWLSQRESRVKMDRRDYHDTGLKKGFAELIVGKEPFGHIRGKKRVFRHLLQILKPDGRIVFSDLFLTGDDPECPEVAVWSALERRPMYLTNPHRFRDMADDLGFDAPEFEDITPFYAESIRRAFSKTREILEAAGPLAPKLEPWLVAEAEYWNRRMTLLESGEARVHCVRMQPYTGADLV